MSQESSSNVERLHNESSASDGENTEYTYRRCNDCGRRDLGKMMSSCEHCNRPMCQSCNHSGDIIGCYNDEKESICKPCFEIVYSGKSLFCDKPSCDCTNRPDPD